MKLHSFTLVCIRRLNFDYFNALRLYDKVLKRSGPPPALARTRPSALTARRGRRLRIPATHHGPRNTGEWGQRHAGEAESKYLTREATIKCQKYTYKAICKPLHCRVEFHSPTTKYMAINSQIREQKGTLETRHNEMQYVHIFAMGNINRWRFTSWLAISAFFFLLEHNKFTIRAIKSPGVTHPVKISHMTHFRKR